MEDVEEVDRRGEPSQGYGDNQPLLPTVSTRANAGVLDG